MDDVFVLADDASEGTVMSPAFLRQLHQYARDRIRSGIGIAELEVCGLNVPTILECSQAGFLPSDFRDVLSIEQLAELDDAIIGNSLLMPAYDENNVLVDLACYHIEGEAIKYSTPKISTGLLIPRVITAYQEIIITTDIKQAAALFKAGTENILLLRSDDELETHRELIKQAGVTSIIQASDVVNLTCTKQDDVRGIYVFDANDLKIQVNVPWTGSAQLDLRLVSDKKEQHYRFDATVAKQRQRFLGMLTRTFILSEVQAKQYLSSILEKLAIKVEQEEVGESAAPKTIALPTPAQRRDNSQPNLSVSDALLSNPKLTEQFCKDMQHCMWIGDEEVKLLSLLTLVGRHLPKPPWLQLRGQSILTAGPLQILAQICPSNDLVHVSKLSGSSLYHGDADSLKHKALILDHANHLRAEAVLSLSILAERGSLTFQQSERDPVTNRMRVASGEARGPVTCISTAGKATPLDDYMMIASLDESAEQTERIIEAQLQHCGDIDQDEKQLLITGRWRRILETVKSKSVHIPFASRIQFPSSQVQHRRELSWFLSLIKASALLHQQQREQDDETIIASEADFDIAYKAAHRFIGQQAFINDAAQERLLDNLWHESEEMGVDVWSSAELKRLTQKMTRYKREQTIDGLVEAGFIACDSNGRGRRARQYTVQISRQQAQENQRSIYLQESAIISNSSAIYLPSVS